MDSREGSEAPSSEEDFYGDGHPMDTTVAAPAPAQEMREHTATPRHGDAPAPDGSLLHDLATDATSSAVAPADTNSHVEEIAATAAPIVASRAPSHNTTNAVEQSPAPVTAHTNGTAMDAEADDSGSDMEMSSDSSRSSSPEAPHEEPVHAGTKRKADETDADPLDILEQTLEEDSNKRPRLTPTPAPIAAPKTSRASRLPTELWQQIFLRMSPVMLARCLRVSKTFNAYLTQTKALPVAKRDAKKVRVLDSNAVWAESRKVFFSTIPRPLGDMTELAMLQLVGGKQCQFCHRDPVPALGTTPFNSGPGEAGVRVIWPFGIRTCGACLDLNTVKVR